jgi:hypothetical protein
VDDIAGVWDVRVKTPIGTIAAVYAFAATPDGLAGTATAKDESVPLTDLAADGARVTWRQSVTRPMRLHLEFDVTVDGDTLAGHSRAGRLPRTAVTGVRRREERA